MIHYTYHDRLTEQYLITFPNYVIIIFNFSLGILLSTFGMNISRIKFTYYVIAAVMRAVLALIMTDDD